MNLRKKLLIELVRIESNIYGINEKLKQFDWDSEIPLYIVSIEDFLYVLNLFLGGNIKENELIDWANFIECRDDLEFENEIIRERVFTIANNDINDFVSKDNIVKLLNEVKSLLL